jgi:uncharacterized protein YdbL (DUF1318 family)
MTRTTPTTRRARIAALVLAAILALLPVASAQADALDDAKSSGQVGEGIDGLLGLVSKSTPPDVVKLVATVNEKRMAGYAAIAKKNGTTVQAVAALAGKKATAMTEPGNYVQNSAGDWVKKP